MKIKYEELKQKFYAVLLKRGLAEKDASDLAGIFADNSRDGVATHGTNRFPVFIDFIDKGFIKPDVKPETLLSLGAFERWDGNKGIGPLNAKLAMDKACDLAEKYTVGCVALGNSNHWMRGGSYGWQAADRGCIGICWSNTDPNMPAWGARDVRIGNNPIVFAAPGEKGRHVVVDCALSQFSYGKLEETRLKGEKLPVPGGYDTQGRITDDPVEIEKSRRLLPMGYWKGSSISVLLDLIATLLTNANPVFCIGKEMWASQIMIAIDVRKINADDLTSVITGGIVGDLKKSLPVKEDAAVFYPGEIEYNTRMKNLAEGIDVLDEVWKKICTI
jgi:3-dehydro-L-gulonate 2-dehydrogenase